MFYLKIFNEILFSNKDKKTDKDRYNDQRDSWMFFIINSKSCYNRDFSIYRFYISNIWFGQ